MKKLLLILSLSLSTISAQAASMADCKACMNACADGGGTPGDCFFACVDAGRCSASRPDWLEPVVQEQLRSEWQ